MDVSVTVTMSKETLIKLTQQLYYLHICGQATEDFPIPTFAALVLKSLVLGKNDVAIEVNKDGNVQGTLF